MTAPRLYLSPPHMSGQEAQLVQEVFTSNWNVTLRLPMDTLLPVLFVGGARGHTIGIASLSSEVKKGDPK